MGGGWRHRLKGIDYLFNMLFSIRGSLIFVLYKQVTNDTLGLEFFEIRNDDADNRRAYPCT